MPAKKLGVVALSLLLVTAGLAVWSGWALLSIPEFYAEALDDAPHPEVREQAARQFVEQTLHLVEEIRESETWSEEFTQTQVNSWLDAHLHRYRRYVPKGVSEPRVQFDDGLLRVGFRYTSRKWDGVVSLELRPSVPEPNRLAIEIESVRAGLLPIPLDDFKARISREFAKEGFDTEWQTTEEGSEALFVDLDRGQEAAPVLETVEVLDGAIRIAGSRETDTTTEQSRIETVYRVAQRTQRTAKQKVQ